jgi:MFS family permease
LRQSNRYRRLRALAFALGAAAFVLAFFHRVAPGVVAADLRATFDTSATMLGFIAAFYFYPYAAMQLPSGVLADTIGPRRLFTAGTLVAGAGSLVFAFALDVPWLLAGRALVGLGVAVAFVSVLKLIASWFSEREFGTWVGVLQMLGNLGGVLGAWPLAWALTYVSWRSVFVATGVISLLLAAGIWFGVRDSPREAGLEPVHPEDRAAQENGAGWFAGLKLVAANPQTWAAFTMHLGLIGSYLTFSGLWAVPMLTDGFGLSRSDATLHVTAMILGFAFGAPAVGALSDRLGRRRPLLRGLSLLFLVSWTPWVLGWHLPYAASLAAFIFMGISMAESVLCWALAKELNPPSLSGTATSLVNAGGFLGVALLQPLVGWILDRSAGSPVLVGYQWAAGLLALVALVGVVAAFRLRETHCRNVYAEFRHA